MPRRKQNISRPRYARAGEKSPLYIRRRYAGGMNNTIFFPPQSGGKKIQAKPAANAAGLACMGYVLCFSYVHYTARYLMQARLLNSLFRPRRKAAGAEKKKPNKIFCPTIL